MSRTTTVSSTMSPSMAGLLDHQRASIARLGPGGPSPWPDSAARTAAPRWSPRAQRADHTVESPGSHAPAPRIAVLRADLLRLARRRRRLRHDGYRRQRAHRVLAPVPADPRGVRLAARAHRRSLLVRLPGVGDPQPDPQPSDRSARTARNHAAQRRNGRRRARLAPLVKAAPRKVRAVAGRVPRGL